MIRAHLLAVAVALAACGGAEGGGGAADGAGVIDAATGSADAAVLATTCEGPCAIITLDATFGATTRRFERAYFGFTRGATTTLHIEASIGGIPGCPTNVSPAPDVMFVMNNLSVPTEPGPLPATGALLDLEGTLLPEVPSSSASSVVAGPTAYDGAELIALEIAADFEAGTVRGHLFATHCPILDAAE